MIISNFKVDSYVLLTRPLCFLGIQLACVKYDASVHSEPGSNSQILRSIIKSFILRNIIYCLLEIL